jgi:hypothetical protein
VDGTARKGEEVDENCEKYRSEYLVGLLFNTY